ncbi:MAG: DegT/DnrJ/EryC1/StrS family aminotransferase [Chlorobiaceae bacterium]|nr:DegT/DnrJ/EryC1/StrS family aminotransferase [Chlorobiaceae bacterium]
MAIIPQADPSLRIARFRQEIDRAIGTTLSSRHYILGPAVEKFEHDFAAYLGVRHCVGVASGTDALALSLRSMGVGKGDEVITTALTAPATAQAILQCGAIPRFVDIDPASRCLDTGAVEAAITERTAAIIPVHLFGHPADMPRLMGIAGRHDIAVIEDCAQAHGAMIDGRRLGSFGHAAAFSFYPTKNLGGVGDSGAIVTNDDAIDARLRSLRNYGIPSGQKESSAMGFNSRMDELQAAILSVLLPYLDAGNAERRALAGEYRRELTGVGLCLPPDADGAIYHQFAIACRDRDHMARSLREMDIQTLVHYHPPLHYHPAFRTGDVVHLPECERLSSQLLSLPIQPEVASGNTGYISRSIMKVMGL